MACELHSRDAEEVERWWDIAKERDADVSVCICCGGPAPVVLDEHGMGTAQRCKLCP